MGRHTKQIGATLGVDRRASGYYSTPEFVATFIADQLLELNPAGQWLLDPCVGRGEMAAPFVEQGVAVDGFDVLPFPAQPGVRFSRRDFLQYFADEQRAASPDHPISLPYDFIVANPPYNCHEVEYIRDNKELLSRVFSSVGAHNMYSMFLSAIVESAREGALIGVLTLDSFLTARAHVELRRQILRECAVHHLLLCPTDLFLQQHADVRTCILILQKGKRFQGQTRVLNRPLTSLQFQEALHKRQFETVSLSDLVLTESGDRDQFLVGVPSELRALFAEQRLGERFNCVTGISTGDDRQYLSKTKRPNFTIPFYKNPGTRKFYTCPNAFLTDNFVEVSHRVPNFMVRNKDILGQPGITCSSMGVEFSACYLPANSTFGVNPNIILSDAETWWLMAYLNSDVATYLIRGVLIRSNMVTSGYVSRLPVPRLSRQTRQHLGHLARSAHDLAILGRPLDHLLTEINLGLAVELGLSRETSAALAYFKRNLIRAT